MATGALKQKPSGAVSTKASGAALEYATDEETGCCCGFYPLIRCSDDVASAYTVTANFASGHLAEIFRRTADGVCYYLGTLTETAGTPAGGGTWWESCEACGCVKLMKCLDDSDSGFSVDAAEALAHAGEVLLSDGVCLYLGDPTACPANPPTAGTWYDDCGVCLDESGEVECVDMGKKPTSVTFTAVGVLGGMCYDFYAGATATSREQSSGNSDGTWTVDTFGVDGAWGVNSGLPAGPANQNPIAGFPLAIRILVPPYDSDPTPGVALPDHDPACLATTTTLTQMETGEGYIESGGTQVDAVGIVDTIPPAAPAPGFPKVWGGYYVWRVQLRCRTGPDDPRGNTFVEDNQICYAPSNGAATCGGAVIVTYNW